MNFIDLKYSRALPHLKYSDLAKYYDSAFLLEAPDPAFVGFLTQEVHNEPYMAIDFPKVDLVNYQGGNSLEDVLDFMD